MKIKNLKLKISVVLLLASSILLLASRPSEAASASASASVNVKATIAQSLTVSIAGLGDNIPVNTGNSACQNSETTNSGNPSSSTVVNLGRLKDTPTATDIKIGNLSAQLITVTTNAFNGYVLSASSSGHLNNQNANFSLSDTPTPSAIPLGQNFFGFHPCGLDTDQSLWMNTPNQACNSMVSGSSSNLCKYAWPDLNSSLILAQDPTGPVGENLQAGNGVTTIQYGAGIDSTVPGGNYQTTIRYIITPTF